MSNRTKTVALLSFLVAGGMWLRPVTAAPPNEEAIGKLALAEEFASAARKTVSKPSPDISMVHQSVALLQAACAECNFEPRFPRLLAEACLQLNDRDGAIKALSSYRAIQLPEVQNDQFAQVELIDLYTATKEDADAKLKYLGPLLGVALPDPVRSHIAVVCSDLYKLRLDMANSHAMLDTALKLNPLNADALQRQYENAQTNGTAVDRVAALVALLKCNPIQPAVMGALGDELSSAGLSDQAVTWYGRSFELAQQLNMSLDPDRYRDYAATLYSMDQVQQADQAAALLLRANPADVQSAILRLLCARELAANPPTGHPPAANGVQIATDGVTAAIAAKMGTFHAMFSGAPTSQPSTTQPVDMIGDITKDAPQMQAVHAAPQASDRQKAFIKAYAAGLSELIWVDAYFNKQPDAAAKLIDILRPLEPSGDPAFTRLEGFVFLAQGKNDEAKVKLSAVADQDPLAKMGMLQIQPMGPATMTDAAALVSAHPSGLVGATLLDALRDKGGKFTAGADTLNIQNIVAGFPLKLLDIIVPGKTQTFYTLLSQPIRASRGFDEPALTRVTIKNVGDFDLSVGTGGAIRSDLWFDVVTPGVGDGSYSGVSYDRIAGPLVLKAHQLGQPGIDQVVRVDQGPLVDLLAAKPTIAVSMLFSVFTNPVGISNGVVPGPGGYRQQFSQPMERRASPITTPPQIQELIAPLSTGKIEDRIHCLQLLSKYVIYLRAKNAQQNPNPDQATMDAFVAGIHGALRDPSQWVRYWAQAKMAELDDVSRFALAGMMVKGTDWEQRLLGLLVARDLPPDQAKSIAQSLTGDSVGYVKDFADATLDVLKLPTTAPTTAPSAN